MSVYLYMFSVLSVLSFLFRKTVFLSNECYPMTLQWLTYIHRVPLSGTEIAFSEQCPLLCTAQTSTMDICVSWQLLNLLLTHLRTVVQARILSFEIYLSWRRTTNSFCEKPSLTNQNQRWYTCLGWAKLSASHYSPTALQTQALLYICTRCTSSPLCRILTPSEQALSPWYGLLQVQKAQRLITLSCSCRSPTSYLLDVPLTPSHQYHRLTVL